MMKKIRTLLMAGVATVGLVAAQSQASSVVVGAHFGASPFSGNNLIYGANLTFHPTEVYALKLDATLGQNVFMTNPAFVFYPVAYEEMSFGILGGPGYVGYTGTTTTSSKFFSAHIGAVASVKIMPALEAGVDARYIWLFGGSSDYLVMATLGFSFGTGDGW